MKGKILALKPSMVSVGTIASPTILIPFLGAEDSCLIFYPQSVCFHMFLTPCMPNLLVTLHAPNH